MTPIPARRRLAATAWPALVVALFAAATALADGPAAPPRRGGGEAQGRPGLNAPGDAKVITATGTIVPAEVVEVSASAPGVVVKLNADFGSEVKAGEVLAELDTGPAMARHEQERANAARADADLNLAKARYERIRALAAAGAGGAGEAAANDLKVATAELEVAEASVRQSRAAIEAAERSLEATRLRSPVDGVVISRRGTVGGAVGAGRESLYLVARDLRQMRVHAAVPEAEVALVRPGQAARFTCLAFPDRTFSAVVSQVRLDAIVTGNKVSYTVVLDVNNEDRKLLPYLTADVTIAVGR